MHQENTNVETSSDFILSNKEIDNKVQEKSEEKNSNILFAILIIITIIGTVSMTYVISDFRKELIELNPKYNFPKMNDFLMILIICPLIALAKIIIERISRPLCKFTLASKYKNPEDVENFVLGKIYLKKQTSNVFKLLFFITMTSFGYLILTELDYFPIELGGKGYINKMWEAGYPNCFYHWKPNYFDYYYLCGLAFCMTDLIWLLFIYELQSDFLLMLLHHFCTISLISFSFISNYSNIGCIVLFIHDSADIVVYFARIIVNMDIKKEIVIITGIILIAIFLYMRIYILGKVVLSIYYGNNWPWKSVTTFLFLFLCFLIIMHLNWIRLILKKWFTAIYKNKFEDTASFKKYQSSKDK